MNAPSGLFPTIRNIYEDSAIDSATHIISINSGNGILLLFITINIENY